ncbi:rhodanese-like domain-containing protein [Salisaeta longa]|uniref:rhodanese-like domain-containing protein n=1 Tax=Salisaeta longa TaxID=503170 RepID=UPI0003B61495|nr:rhodanese-like domain-containing protein [Salisaeta longa]
MTFRGWATTMACGALLWVGCSDELSWKAVHAMIDATYGAVPTLTTDALAQRLADTTRAAPVLLDARTPEEFAVSHLPGARRIDPGATNYKALQDTLARDTPVVVYCSVGYRSAGVVQQLRQQGFTNVYNLRGSIFQWANEGRPVYRRGRRVQAVHPYDATWGRLLADSLRAYTVE